MACYRPLSAFRYYNPETNKRAISFGNHPNKDTHSFLDLPCGQCIGCRLERSRRWAMRIMHEAELHEHNSFLTLTYNDENLPKDGSLQVPDFQKFMKKLRRFISDRKLRFFHCGEYGDETERPHYHVCLFGEDFQFDRSPVGKGRCGDVLYESPTLTKIWGMGHAWIGELTFESAAYVARYCLKKATVCRGKATVDERLTAYDDYLDGRRAEYVTMSRRPGIGATWFNKYMKDVYPSDSVVMRGREMMPPPFYDKLLAKADPLLAGYIKYLRNKEAKLLADHPDRRSRRLMDREKCKELTVQKTLERKLKL